MARTRAPWAIDRRRSARTPALVRFALACSAVAGGALPAQGAAPTRTARFLELLTRIPVASTGLPHARFPTATNAFGCAVTAPAVAACGFGWTPGFDLDQARALARELCAIYGLRVAADVPAPHGVAAVLDAYDADAHLGVELRQRLATAADVPEPALAMPEAPERDLSVAEHAQLQAHGERVLVADTAAFWSSAAEDRLSTTMAWLCTVARFLNDALPGEDVDTGVLLATRGMWLELPAPARIRNATVQPDGLVVVERATEVVLRLSDRQAHEVWSDGRREPLARLLTNGGAPTVVLRVAACAEPGTCTTHLRQGGKELARSPTAAVFAPGAFDAGAPFELVLRLQPGRFRLGAYVWVGVR
ncbi:MAG: hypothetical protein AB7O97_07800 [Planctomycetota bacterium]